MDVRSPTLAVNGVIADFGNETLQTAAGQPVTLRPQAFAVLRYLAGQAGQLITKDELMGALWPGLVVTDDSLVQCIHEIRRALGDEGRAVLKTVPKRGYRLVLPEETQKRAPTAPPNREPSRTSEESNGASDKGSIGADVGRLPERARVAIAVLPFVNMSSDPELVYFCAGVTQDVTTDLSRWQSITVASLGAGSGPASADLRAVGRDLGVNFLAEGSVRDMGETVRITAQLVDAQTGDHVWAERYDHVKANLHAAQDGLVRKIAGTLVGRIYESLGEQIRRKGPPSPPAYDLTMRGNWLPWSEIETRIEAKRCLEHAIELDPQYGLPSSLLAMLLRTDWYFGLSGGPDVFDRAFALAKQGVACAEFEATSYAAMGFCHLDRRAFDQALSHLTRAVEINPANPANKADLGVILARIGRPEESLVQMIEAQRTDSYFAPPWYWPMRAATQFTLRRYQDALADFDRGDAAGGADSIAMMAGCCAKLGLPERARDLTARCLAIQPEATTSAFVKSIVYKDTGDSDHLAECLRLAGLPDG